MQNGLAIQEMKLISDIFNLVLEHYTKYFTVHNFVRFRKAYILKDAKYDLTTNMSVVDGMTNGAECIIKKIDYRAPSSLRPSIIWVLFQEEHIGKDHRKEYSHFF